MSLIQYWHTEPRIKRVYYEGSDTLLTGYALCYNQDYGTAASADADRSVRVEKPATANLEFFAGVVHPNSDQKVGPAWVELVVPDQDSWCDAYTDQNCTIASTTLYPQNASYALGAASGTRSVGIAAQTVNRSVTNGVVQCWLYGQRNTE